MDSRILGNSLPTTIKNIKQSVEQFQIPPINSYGDWRNYYEILQYTSSSRISVVNTDVDLTTVFAIGDKLQFTQTTLKQFYIYNVTTNYIDVWGGSNTVANATIESVQYSRQGSALGFPSYFEYSPTLSASGSMTASYTSGSANNKLRVSMFGEIVTILASEPVNINLAGTASTEVYFTAPFPLRINGTAYGLLVQFCSVSGLTGTHLGDLVRIQLEGTSNNRFRMSKMDFSNFPVSTFPPTLQWSPNFSYIF